MTTSSGLRGLMNRVERLAFRKSSSQRDNPDPQAEIKRLKKQLREKDRTIKQLRHQLEAYKSRPRELTPPNDENLGRNYPQTLVKPNWV